MPRGRLRARIKSLLQPGIDAVGYTAASYVDLKTQANCMGSMLIRFDAQPATQADERLLEAARLIQPVEAPAHGLTRIGGDHDGGYVMLNTDLPGTAISIGVGPDVSWDTAVASRGVKVHMFDHTVRRPPTTVPNGTFHRLGVGPRDEGRLRKFGSLMRLAKIDGRTRALLKFDVEGAEWATFASCDPGRLEPFDQIVAELHGLDRLLTSSRAGDVLTTLRLLRTHHVPIHVHANNYAPILRFGNFWFPREIEVSWVHRRLADSIAPADRLATELDRPCDPRVADIDISGITQIPVAAE